jgi:hypothetical protein
MESKKPIRFSSRKFIVMQEVTILAALVPIVFSHFGIEPTVTTTSLILIGSAAGAYLGFNVLEKKVGGE